MNVAFLGVVCLLVPAALYWVLGRGTPRPTGTWAMSAFLGSFALALACYTPAFASAVETVMPHTARLLGNCASLAAAAALLTLSFQLNLEASEARRRIRRCLVLFATTIGAMTTLFVYGRTSHRSSEAYALYTLLFLFYLGFANVGFLLQTVRQARSSRRASLRIGLRTAAGGCFFTLVYVAYKLTILVPLGLGFRPEPDGARCSSLVAAPCVFSVTAPALAALLFCLGLTLPTIAYPISQARRRRWEVRCYDALGSLWSDLTAAVPEVVLTPTAVTGEDPNDSDFLLQRRVIEISDGILALRPYRSRTAQDAARRSFDTTTQAGAAAIEAAGIRAALAAHRADELPDEIAPPLPGAVPRKGLRADTEWLLLVAAAYTAQLGGPNRPNRRESV
ncbi:MAB_1171c family putative transporter [Streptomyces sp. HSW2009]|uniref:MAB_1171c family putative transporter n=1 Tax=Streptomyces sp. HSW2009 TaxID=3142890 RepID=UPI0032EF5749